jgi:hypothetical protein
MMRSKRTNTILHILLFNSAKDLFKYKSFFLLIFVLMLLDRALTKLVKVDRSAVDTSEIKQLTLESARYVFESLPLDMWHLLTDYRTFIILAGLFLLKQLISLWPSSDMRRMHRSERGAFGLLGSLAVIRWKQVLWDAIAVGSICGLYAAWSILGYLFTLLIWQATHTTLALMILGLTVALFAPLAMAGFSFSSKLAVISHGSFGQKLGLYFKLFHSKQVLWPAWIFFTLRLVVELIFVFILPLIVLLVVDTFWIRISMATLIATPVYSYLKMISFKFFLEIYRTFPLVKQEYREYYQKHKIKPDDS